MTNLRIVTEHGQLTFDEAHGVVTIGRERQCDVVVDNPHVSRRHAEVRPTDRGWVLTDTGSAQGIHLKGKRVQQLLLSGRESFRFGQNDDGVMVTIEVDAPSSSEAPTEISAGETIHIGEGSAHGRPGGVLREDVPHQETVVTGQALNVQRGEQTFAFVPGRALTIGRDAGCDIVCANPTVSRRHAELRHDGVSWHLVDLESQGGTFVSGSRVSDFTLAGSVAAFLGDPESGERLVLVTSGQTAKAQSTRELVNRTRRLTMVVAAVAVVAVVVAAIAIFAGGRGSSGSRATSDDSLVRAVVRVKAVSYSGSGTIIDAKAGLILTNAHVADPSAPGQAVQYPRDFVQGHVAKAPPEFQIQVSEGLDRAAKTEFLAELVASDGYLDLAVLRITKTSSGALITAADLRGLAEMPIGTSDAVKTTDQVSVVGYPGAAQSLTPTVATGNIASDIQDVRLHTPRAWFNVAGLISSGNSGGALVDDRGRLIGVPTQIGGSGADVAKRARPIDLAKPLIEAAKKGTKYASPYITPLPPKASIGAAAYDGEGGPGGFTSECASSHRNLSTRPPSLRVDVSYSGYEADRHQDMLVWILDQGGAPLPTSDPLLFDTNTQFPFKFNASGCVSIELPVTGIDLTRQTFTVVVAAGPEYRLRSELKLSGGTTDTTTTSTAPSPVDTSAPPVDTGAPPPAG